MSVNPRILLLALDYPPVGGGISRLLDQIVSNSLAEVDWRVVTTTPGPRAAGVFRYHSFASLSSALPTHARWLSRAPQRRVVAGHAYMQWAALAVAMMSRTSVSTLVHGRELRGQKLRHGLVLRGLQRSHRVVAVSHHTADVTRGLSVRPSRLSVVNPILRPPWIHQPSPRIRHDGEPLRLIAVGRMAEGYKNLHLLLRLATLFPLDGSIALTLAGDGHRRTALAQMAQSLGVERQIDFPGRVDDDVLGQLLSESHVGLFPSRESVAEEGFEGFGLVVHEMASAGLPVLVGRAGGAVEAAQPEWSVLIDPDDLAAWATAIHTLAGNEPRRFKMAEAAAAWARTVDNSGTSLRFVSEFLA